MIWHQAQKRVKRTKRCKWTEGIFSPHFFYVSSRILGNASKENLSPMVFQKVILTTCPCCCLKIGCKGIDISGCYSHKWCCRFCIWDKNTADYTALWDSFRLVHSSQSCESVSIWSLLLALNMKFMKQSITIFSLTILFLGTTTPASLSAMKRRDLKLVNPWNWSV